MLLFKEIILIHSHLFIYTHTHSILLHCIKYIKGSYCHISCLFNQTTNKYLYKKKFNFNLFLQW